MSFRQERQMRAGKRHTCAWCGEIIEFGELHVSGVSGDGKDLDAWRLHTECAAAVHRTLDEFPDDDGCPLSRNMPRGLTVYEADQKARSEAVSCSQGIQRCIDCDGPTGKSTEDSVFLGERGPFCEECADRLVAAAPEMLEVLEWLAEEFDRRDLGDGAMFCDSDIEQVKAVIRKARGEQ